MSAPVVVDAGADEESEDEDAAATRRAQIRARALAMRSQEEVCHTDIECSIAHLTAALQSVLSEKNHICFWERTW